MAYDQFGRSIHYLRISVTDRCNLNCVYCRAEKLAFLPHEMLMSDDEIITFVQLFTTLGFNKFRLTGGEPTLRHGIVRLVSAIADMPGVEQLTMTSNGLLLEELALPLAKAGLQRVNISLDTLDAQKFCQLTGKGKLETVLEGIRAAEDAALFPIKINAVVVDLLNDDEVLGLASLTLNHAWQVRYIEMMPLGQNLSLQKERFISAAQIKQRIEQRFGNLILHNEGQLDGEARIFSIAGAKGSLGFIASVSHAFCDTCTRMRLTADGRLRLCLLVDGEIDLLTPLRMGASKDELRSLILQAVWQKPKGHELANASFSVSREMSQIGG